MASSRSIRSLARSVLPAVLVAVGVPCLPGPVLAETYTYRLSQSTGALQLWTTPATVRVFKNAAVPANLDGGLRVYAAGNESEPFQLVVRPAASGPVTLSIGSFGAGITSELAQVKYVPVTNVSDNLGRTGDYPDPLWPLALPATVTLAAGENTAFWFTLRVPPGTAAGDYTTSVQVGGVTVPVQLHVFGFDVPGPLHLRSEMTVDYGSIMSAYSVTNYFPQVEIVNRFMAEHRLTPSIPTWPGGLTGYGGAPLVSYDCNGHLSDPDGVWGFEVPAAKYLGGVGFNNGNGFPSFRAAQSGSPSPSEDQRPLNFCGKARGAGDWVPGSAGTPYNLEWKKYVTGLRNYLAGLGYLDQAYWIVGNEPQNQADYDAIAWYAQLLKSAAPDFALAVSEEPRPEIFANPTYPGAKIDLWMAYQNNFDPQVSWDRDANHGEATWTYFLSGTRTPRFNPITLDHPGTDARVAGWFAWKYRLRGIEHYSMNDWGANRWLFPWTDGQNGGTFLLYPPSTSNVPIPFGSNGNRLVSSIRLELLRDGFEDYEYLYALAGGSPQAGVSNAADALADRVVGGLTAHNRNAEYYHELRRQIGLYLGGETATFPDAVPPAENPRAEGGPASYYINFQDPAGAPLDDPLVVDGKTYMKIGWPAYDAALGYGWYGDLAHVMTSYQAGGPNELQRSIIWDDYGLIKTFEFDLPNGTYDVTVSVGWPGRTYPHNKVVVEGVTLVGDEASSPYLVRTQTVTVGDHKLTMEIGVAGEYTLLNFMDVVPHVDDADGDGLPDGYELQHACLDVQVSDSALDPDGDGLTSWQEFSTGTDPCNDDSDGGGDNDRSELSNERAPLDPSDDVQLVLMVHRSGTDVLLDWSPNYGSNGATLGPYYVTRSSTLPLGPADLVYGPLPDFTFGITDPDPPGSICFYEVRNTQPR